MRSLARMAIAELQALIRTDPSQRVAAWAEITYRNQARQAFEGENPKFIAWEPPDLTPPAPLQPQEYMDKWGDLLSGKFDTTGKDPKKD